MQSIFRANFLKTRHIASEATSSTPRPSTVTAVNSVLVMLHVLQERIALVQSLGTLNLSQYLTNLRHKICFTISFISCLCMFRAHLLIIRRSKLHYTASGIITHI